jgi:hypothetical protein
MERADEYESGKTFGNGMRLEIICKPGRDSIVSFVTGDHPHSSKPAPGVLSLKFPT